MSTIAKTQEERREIKIQKVKCKETPKGCTFTPREELIQLPLIVYMKKSPRVEKFKSTHSFKVFKNDVMNTITLLKDQGYVIGKVYYNLRPYHYE